MASRSTAPGQDARARSSAPTDGACGRIDFARFVVVHASVDVFCLLRKIGAGSWQLAFEAVGVAINGFEARARGAEGNRFSTAIPDRDPRCLRLNVSRLR